MLKYSLNVQGKSVTVALDTTNPNEPVNLQFTGDDGTIAQWLSFQYGAFGHLIGVATSPIDLHAAMSSPQAKAYTPVLLEGRDIVKSYDPGIPDGALT